MAAPGKPDSIAGAACPSGARGCSSWARGSLEPAFAAIGTPAKKEPRGTVRFPASSQTPPHAAHRKIRSSGSGSRFPPQDGHAIGTRTDALRCDDDILFLRGEAGCERAKTEGETGEDSDHQRPEDDPLGRGEERKRAPDLRWVEAGPKE